MNNQIVEISCEDLELVSGGTSGDGFKKGVENFGKGLIKPLGFYGHAGSVWSCEDVGDCSLSGNGKAGAVGTAIADMTIISGIMAAGYFVFNKITALKH